MKAALIKANHGNHVGFNRTWLLEKLGTKAECKEALKNYSDEIEDNYKLVIITQDDINNDFFNGGSNGYFPRCLNEIFAAL